MADKTSLDEAVELAERVLKDGLLGMCPGEGPTAGESARKAEASGDLVLFLDFGLRILLDNLRVLRTDLDDARRAWCQACAFYPTTAFGIAKRRWGIEEARRLFGEGGSDG